MPRRRRSKRSPGGWSRLLTIAGLIMKLAGGMLLWVVIAVIFFRWFDQEQRDGLDRSAYQNVQREIGAELGR